MCEHGPVASLPATAPPPVRTSLLFHRWKIWRTSPSATPLLPSLMRSFISRPSRRSALSLAGGMASSAPAPLLPPPSRLGGVQASPGASWPALLAHAAP